MYNPLVVTHPSFYYYSTTNDFPDLPRFAKNCNFRPALSKQAQVSDTLAECGF